VDDAAAGQRGTRAIASAELERFLRAHWGVRPATAAPDLGGSVNLNLLVTDDRSVQVARVYRPVVTGQRVAVLQAVRRHLASQGVPRAEPIAVAPATRIGLPLVSVIGCSFARPGCVGPGRTRSAGEVQLGGVARLLRARGALRGRRWWFWPSSRCWP